MVAAVCAIVLIPNCDRHRSFLGKKDTTYLGKHPWVVKPSRGQFCLWADMVKFSQQVDAFLLVRIGAGDDRNAVLRIAEIVGQMGHISGDVDKVAALGGEVFFQALAVPHAGFAAQDINAGFVTKMPVRLGPSTGRYSYYLKVDCLRTYRLRRDPGGIQES